MMRLIEIGVLVFNMDAFSNQHATKHIFYKLYFNIPVLSNARSATSKE